MKTPIIFIQPHLEFGGAEKQTVLLANALMRSGHKVTVVLFDDSGPLVSELEPEIEVLRVGYDRHELLLITSFQLLRTLRAMPASTIIVKLWSAISAVGLIQKKLEHHKFVYTEDLDPVTHTSFIRFGAVKQLLVKGIFRKQKMLVTNSPIIARSMVQRYKLEFNPRVISPIVDTDNRHRRGLHDTKNHSDGAEPTTNIISTGSLTKLKGYASTWEALRSSKYSYRWLIFGDGPLKDQILSYKSPNVEVVYCGTVVDPYLHYPPDALFVHSSYSESFGVAIAEALSVGLPVISSDTKGGKLVAELTSNGAGFMKLVPIGSSTALRREIELFVNRDPISSNEKLLITQSVDRMSTEVVLAEWQNLIEVDLT